MVNIIKAEHQKAKRTMRKKFIWGFPLLTFVMAFIFTLGMTNAYAESVWNWWYTLLLPGMIALFCYLSVAQEKKIKYYHLTTIPTDRRKLLLGKIIYIGYMILFSNVIVFAGATLGGFLLTTHVPVGGALIAVLFLTVSELWEIPVALFLSLTLTEVKSAGQLSHDQHVKSGFADLLFQRARCCQFIVKYCGS